MPYVAAYQHLIERLADKGEPLALNAHDLATVLTHDPSLLASVACKTQVVQSVTKILQQGPKLTIETAACMGAALAGAIMAHAHNHVAGNVRAELKRRRFASARSATDPRETH
jgi:hypothetical protein